MFTESQQGNIECTTNKAFWLCQFSLLLLSFVGPWYFFFSRTKKALEKNCLDKKKWHQ